VCVVLSALVTVTRPPPTVSVLGLNAKLSILIALALFPDVADEEPPLDGVGAFAVPEPPPQPASRAAAAPTAASELIMRYRCIPSTVRLQRRPARAVRSAVIASGAQSELRTLNVTPPAGQPAPTAYEDAESRGV
jgi:hypothetical protein